MDFAAIYSSMKKKDVAVLAHLRQDGRMSLTSLSRKTGIPHSTLFDKIRSKNLPVQRHTILLDFEKLGFSTRAYILLAVDKAQKQELIAHLNAIDQVNSLFQINNGWDVMLECVFHDMRSLEAFVDQVEAKFSIKEKQVHYVLDEFKREGFLADPTLAKHVIPEKI